MSKKPSTPKGTRDFSPSEVARRNYIIGILRKHFERSGYAPIETPSFENLETLMGKYGDEGDRLVFKILGNGDFLSGYRRKGVNPLEEDINDVVKQISKKALRYDLTVPFARYVVQYQNDITTPFKRYQIQPVWRADRPQKGRFQEFYQCDADVVGSNSLWQEVELTQIYDGAFTDLGLHVEIRLNNRKILNGIAEVCGIQDKLVEMTVALDKLDKIGRDGVINEWSERGISKDQIEKMLPLLDLSGSNAEKIAHLNTFLKESEIGLEGVQELKFVLDQVEAAGMGTSNLVADVTLARGLNYYTGTIFEVAALDAEMGSIGGGGRYDDLTGIFGLKNMSGVGISFGLDRIYLVMEELGLFPETVQNNTQVLFIHFGEKEATYIQPIIRELRSRDYRVEMYPDAAKLKKQFSYADKKNIPFVATVGSHEMESGVIVLKDMKTGEEMSFSPDEVYTFLSKTF